MFQRHLLLVISECFPSIAARIILRYYSLHVDPMRDFKVTYEYYFPWASGLVLIAHTDAATSVAAGIIHIFFT